MLKIDFGGLGEAAVRGWRQAEVGRHEREAGMRDKAKGMGKDAKGSSL